MANSVTEAAGQSFSTVKDRTGVEHRLYPLTVRDWIELEKEVGSVFNWAAIGIKIETWAYLIWMSIRKNGITRKDEYARRFKIGLEEMCDLFDISQSKQMLDAVETITSISGMPMGDGKGADSNRPTESAEKTTGGGNT